MIHSLGPMNFIILKKKCSNHVENACKMVKCWHRLQRAGTTSLERPPKYDGEARDLPPTLPKAPGSSHVAKRNPHGHFPAPEAPRDNCRGFRGQERLGGIQGGQKKVYRKTSKVIAIPFLDAF